MGGKHKQKIVSVEGPLAIQIVNLLTILRDCLIRWFNYCGDSIVLIFLLYFYVHCAQAIYLFLKNGSLYKYLCCPYKYLCWENTYNHLLFQCIDNLRIKVYLEFVNGI